MRMFIGNVHSKFRVDRICSSGDDRPHRQTHKTRSSQYSATPTGGGGGVKMSLTRWMGGCRWLYRIRGRSDSRSEWFHVDRRSGLVTTSMKFSCVTVGDYRLAVVARCLRGAVPRLILATSVTVRVRPVDRHRPVFRAGFYSVAVAEDEAVSTCLLRVSIDLRVAKEFTVYDVAPRLYAGISLLTYTRKRPSEPLPNELFLGPDLQNILRIVVSLS